MEQTFKLLENNEQIIYNGELYNLSDVRIELDYPIGDKQKQNQIENSEILLIRHALSEFNFQNRVSNRKHRQDYHQKKQIEKKLQIDPSFCDSKLHQLGIVQVQNQVKHVHNLNFSVVFFSPLQRVLQTLTILFKDHPKKYQIQFVVIPELSESMGWSTSITTNSNEQIMKMQKENNFNINMKFFQQQNSSHEFNKWEHQPLFWAINNLTNEHKRQEIFQFLKQYCNNEQQNQEKQQQQKEAELILIKPEQYQSGMLKYFETHKFCEKIESGSEVIQRCQNAKNKMKNFLKEQKIEFNQRFPENKQEFISKIDKSTPKIAVIAHAILLNYFSADGVHGKKQEPLNGIHCKNSDLNPYNKKL